MKRFRGALKSVDFEAVPVFASKIRQSDYSSKITLGSSKSCLSESIPCKIVGVPLCGSYHIIFTLEFDDDVKWMLKVPANGHRFDSVAAAALISEVRTMQLLKSATTIPIPTVYAFDESSRNNLNTPFILMEYLDGQPLYRGWFNDEIPKARLEHFRVRALQSLAEAMSQLNKFTLDRGGALEFDSTGKIIGLRGAKVADAVAMYDWGPGSENKPEVDQDSVDNDDQNHCRGDGHNQDENEHTVGRKEAYSKPQKSTKDEENDEDKICEKGPFDCPKSAFLFDLDRCDALRKSSVYTDGCYKALRMFVNLAFSNHNNHGKGFVLTHPDLDVQNILVAEDGTLRGLIDWDGAASVPREIGCAQYPLWLMRDWLPYYYLYDIREGRTEEDAGYEESSPAELASYRAMYSHFMEKEIERQTGGPDRFTNSGTLPKQEAQLTRRSLVMRDLDLAASRPFLTTDILFHILGQVERVTEPEWSSLDLETDFGSSSSSQDESDDDHDINSDVKDDTDLGRPEIEATETDDELSYPKATTASSSRADNGAAVSKRLSLKTILNTTESPSGVPKHDSRCQVPSDGCQTEAKMFDIEQSSGADPKADSSPQSVRLGWGRRLLCLGCNTAEKGLRRIAKIGHVLEDTVGEVAEALAEVDLHQQHKAEHSNEGEPWQTINPLGHQNTDTAEHKDSYSTQGVEERGQVQAIRPARTTPQLSGSLATQDTTETDRPDEIAPIQATLKMRDILARKAELIEKTEKARKKADYRADKALIKEELKVWEQIAFKCWSRGVSLEELQSNQSTIAHWVIDTLSVKNQQEDNLVAGVHPQQATGPEKQGEKVLPGSRHEDTDSRGPSTRTIPSNNIAVAMVQSETPIDPSKLAGKSVIGPKAMAVAMSTQSLRPQSLPEFSSWSKKASSGFQAVCSFGASCLKKIFSNHNKSLNDDKGSLSPNGSISDSSDENSNRNDTEESCKSSVTSLNDDEVEFSENLKNDKNKNEGDMFGTAITPPNKDHDEESDGNTGSAVWEDFASNENRETMGSHNKSTIASGNGRENGFDRVRSPRSVYESYTGRRAGLKSKDNPNMNTKIEGSAAEGKAAGMKSTEHCEDGQNTKTAKDAEGDAGSDDDSESVGEGGNGGDAPPFEDDGEFRSRNIFTLLGMDKLDELRLLRMQEGFLKLLEQY